MRSVPAADAAAAAGSVRPTAPAPANDKKLRRVKGTRRVVIALCLLVTRR